MPKAFELISPLVSVAGSDLTGFIQSVDAELTTLAAAQTGLLGRLTEYVFDTQGKRLRPALVFLFSRWGSADPKTVLQSAVAVEMLHLATLVHDDVVDEAFVRRRKPTVAVQFGEGPAVLLGDYIYAEAFRRLSEISRGEFVPLFSRVTSLMCAGEIGQWESRGEWNLSEEAYLSFLQKKTASLMAACCRVGAALAGLPVTVQEEAEKFGSALGLAFQIVDDVLDVEGDEIVVGKTLRTDLSHGKMTLPLIRLIQENPQNRADLVNLLKEAPANFGELRKRLHQSQALPYAREKVREEVAEALRALEKLPPEGPRPFLSDLAQRLSSRSA